MAPQNKGQFFVGHPVFSMHSNPALYGLKHIIDNIWKKKVKNLDVITDIKYNMDVFKLILMYP